MTEKNEIKWILIIYCKKDRLYFGVKRKGKWYFVRL